MHEIHRRSSLSLRPPGSTVQVPLSNQTTLAAAEHKTKLKTAGKNQQKQPFIQTPLPKPAWLTTSILPSRCPKAGRDEASNSSGPLTSSTSRRDPPRPHGALTTPPPRTYSWRGGDPRLSGGTPGERPPQWSQRGGRQTQRLRVDRGARVRLRPGLGPLPAAGLSEAGHSEAGHSGAGHSEAGHSEAGHSEAGERREVWCASVEEGDMHER